MRDFFLNPVFQDALADIESLGVNVHRDKKLGSKPYAVVGGRSNNRWWLLPLDSGCVTASGLALFQPFLRSAKALKAIASLLSLLGLSYLWVRHKVYITGVPVINDYFKKGKPLNFAYFTGTDTPHRKVTVQIMDGKGGIKGFAKLSRNPPVQKLLAQEAAMLSRVQRLGLKSAHTPKVIYFGQYAESTLLLTDTIKTRSTRSTTYFTELHQKFIEELCEQTKNSEFTSLKDVGVEFHNCFKRFRARLDKEWQYRLDNAIDRLLERPDLKLVTSLTHGDFTPWNTFVSNDSLYVFDWEYAATRLPISNDLIHWILNQPNIRNFTTERKLAEIKYGLSKNIKNIPHGVESELIIVYLLTICLRQMERESEIIIQKQEWDGAQLIAELMDAVVLGSPLNIPRVS